MKKHTHTYIYIYICTYIYIYTLESSGAPRALLILFDLNTVPRCVDTYTGAPNDHQRSSRTMESQANSHLQGWAFVSHGDSQGGPHKSDLIALQGHALTSNETQQAGNNSINPALAVGESTNCQQQTRRGKSALSLRPRLNSDLVVCILDNLK